MAPSKKRMAAVAVAIGRRIAAARIAAGMTQEQLAERLGSTKSVLSRVENGFAIPSVQRLTEIADILDVELRELFDAVARSADPCEAEIAEIASMLRGRPVADARHAVEMVRVLLKK